MKTFASMLFVASLLTVSSRSFASDPASPSVDRAAQLLAQSGIIFVESAKFLPKTPAVQCGDEKPRVHDILGFPARHAGDDLWIYDNYTVDGSRAYGVLLVYFANDQVSQMTLVTPRRAAALLARRPTTVRVAADTRK